MLTTRRRFLAGVSAAALGASKAHAAFSSFALHGPTGHTTKTAVNLQGPFTLQNSESPFINVLKQGRGWYPQTGSSGSFSDDRAEMYLLYSGGFLDSNGYITTFSGGPTHSFTALAVTVLNGWVSPYYQSGTYIFYYSGTATFDFAGDATYVSGAGTGRIVLTVTPSASGITIFQKSTGAGAAYGKDFALMYSGDETDYLANKICTSRFVSTTTPTCRGGVRFMKWGGIDTQNYQVDWADRLTLGSVFWTGSPKNVRTFRCDPAGADDGVPIEVMAKVCNELNCDGWFCMPSQASEDYIYQAALLVDATLTSSLNAYIEWANEPWNNQLGTQLFGNITASIASNVLTITAVPSNGFGGPYITAGMQIDDQNTGGHLAIDPTGVSQTMITGQLTSTEAGGALGGRGTYSLSSHAAITSVASETMGLQYKGAVPIDWACYRMAPVFLASNFGSGSLNRYYARYAGSKVSDIWKFAFANPARVIRVYGGQIGDDAGNANALPALATANGEATASFTGVIVSGVLTASAVTGTLAVGQNISGSGVPAALYIVTDNGGGSYTLNRSVSVSSRSMTAIFWTGTVASHLDKHSVAPYTECALFTTDTPDDVFNRMFSPGNSLDILKAELTAAATTATNNLLGLVCYEAGPDFGGNGQDPLIVTLLQSVGTHARMGDVINRLLTDAQAAGVSAYFYYADVDPFGTTTGFDWGLRRSVYETTAVKYDTYKAW